MKLEDFVTIRHTFDNSKIVSIAKDLTRKILTFSRMGEHPPLVDSEEDCVYILSTNGMLGKGNRIPCKQIEKLVFKWLLETLKYAQEYPKNKCDLNDDEGHNPELDYSLTYIDICMDDHLDSALYIRLTLKSDEAEEIEEIRIVEAKPFVCDNEYETAT